MDARVNTQDAHKKHARRAEGAEGPDCKNGKRTIVQHTTWKLSGPA